MNRILVSIIVAVIVCSCSARKDKGIIVVQTDFGEKDGAVAAMRGVALGVDKDLVIADLTHEIPAYNIWDAAYRLNQVIRYWPTGTVFVSVVDPGVGTTRRSVVVKTKKDHYVVTPDNGTLTLVAESEGIESVRLIDETLNRREGSEASYTFHGRDVYMFTAARLASGEISFKEVGPESSDPLVILPYQRASDNGGTITGNIPALDVQYGNVWTNIPDSILSKNGIKVGDSLNVSISANDSVFFSEKIPLVNTFGQVPEGKPLAYFNSLMNFSVAINMDDFAKTYHISSGPEWSVIIKK